MTSYSQYGEDLQVAAIFEKAPGNSADSAHAHHVLDIGAWGVKDLSNSRLFIEQGWKATLVEFSPGPVRELVRQYGYDARVRIIQAAITAEPDHVREFQITDDALSATPDSETCKTWAENGGYFGTLWVPTLTVKQLLDQFFGAESIDYVSIDTEGTSVDIAIALIRTDHKPKVICTEHDNRIVELMAVAQENGYTSRWMNAVNVILSRGI